MFKKLLKLSAFSLIVSGLNAQDTKESEAGMNKSLNEIVISASKKSEKILNSPASVSKLSEARIQQNTNLSIVDNVRKIAAVDVMPTGLVSNNMVIRGFNNIFSGATLYMVDNRMANVPSLRVNAFHLVPTSNSDIRSMEVVRGPSSALYGPFGANGVFAVYTKSPLDMKNRMEITMGLTSGIRAEDEAHATFNPTPDNSLNTLGILNPEIRIAGKINNQLGIKVSGNYLSATDFAFYDVKEPNGKTVNFGNQSGGNLWASDNSAAQTFKRDFKIKKVGLEAKLDWRPEAGTELNFTTGYANNTNVELTGLGAAQAKDWQSLFYQTQFKKGNFFMQYYLNQTNSGNTFLIPQDNKADKFTYLKETSDFHSAQMQHSSKVGEKLSLVYGADLYMTRPSGNVYGRFEGNNVNQYGGYIQGEHKFNKKWTGLAAARMDYQDAIDEWMFSPRAAVTFKPMDNHTFRATYNRSFSAPTALNFFLDLNNGRNTTYPAQLGNQFARGYGNATGFNYNFDPTGNIMYTNFAGQSQAVNTPFSAGQKTAYGTALNALSRGNVPVSVGGFILNGAPGTQNTATTPVDLSMFKTIFDAEIAALGAAAANPLKQADALRKAINGSKYDASKIMNRESVKSTVTQTAELGYKGFVNEKLSLGIDVYYTRMNNFVSPLTAASYVMMVDPTKLEANALAAIRLSPGQGGAGTAELNAFLDLDGNGTVQNELTGVYLQSLRTPQVGTIAPNNTTSGNDIIYTYFNVGDVDLAGSDLSFSYLANKNFTIEGAFSFVNKDKVGADVPGGYITLNAPKYKSALNLEHKLPFDNNNVTARLGWRWSDQFDANSGIYSGRVNATNLFDLGFTWRPSKSENTIVSLNINNVLDHRHRFFPNAAAMGRVALMKIQHTFGVK